MFCAKCGAKIENGAAFCAACGWKVVKRSEGQNEKPVEQAVTQAVDHVENEIRSQVTGKVQSEVTQVTARAKNEIRTQVSGQVKQAAAEATGLLGIDAAELPGEVALGEFGGALGSLSSILGPGRTFVTSIKEFFKSFTSLKALIPALIIAVIWLVQALLTYNGVEGDFLDVTKVITYMRGGLGRSAVGFVGGLIGKGVIAAAFATIVTGGGLQILKGIPRLFTGKNFKKNSIGFYLLGIGLSLMLYQFFAGNATIESIAAAVSAMLLSLRALGGRCGFLFSLVRSMTAKKTAAGARTPRDEKPQALFAGLTAGFALAIPLSLIPSDSDFLSTLSLESNLIPLLLGVLLTVLGLVFTILGVVRTTALATGLLILLLPVLPFFAQKASAVSTFTIIPDWDMEEFREGGLFYKSNYGWHPAHTMFLFANAGELTIESTGNGYHLTVPGVSGEWNNELQGQDLEGNSYWVKKWEYEGFSMTAPKEEKGKGSIDQCIITFTLDSPFTLYYYHENHWQPKPEWTDDWDIKELTGTVREMKLVLTIREPDGTPNAWMDWEEDVSWVENITGYDSYSGDQDFKHTVENVQKRDRNMGYLTQGFKMPGEDDTEEEEEEIDDEKEIEITTDADEDEGETEEEIEEEIVVKKKKNKKSKKTKSEDDLDPADVALVSTTGAGAAAAGAAAASGKTGTEDADEDKKKKKRYKMKVKKDFGNRISSGEVKEVYARIVEVDPETGEEKDRPDLSDRIEIYSDDGVFEPQMNGGLSSGYKGAVVKVANDVKATEGCICFRFIGEGGSFTNRMRFLVTAPMLEFDQPNIAIAHDFDKPVKPYFVVIGMSDAHKVSAKITPDDAFDVNITEGEDLGVEGAKLYYANITPKSSRPSMEDRDPGASLYYRMEVEAVEPSNGVKVTNELPIARVRTGLTVTAKSIDCFWYKHATSEIAEYDGLRRRVVVRDKFAE
ncbi:MAG: hypothetical protein K6B72_02030, partial [Lachnospiraceae bacterium]|nr:hypothetical protein [Lachnospiraceae bacterium]